MSVMVNDAENVDSGSVCWGFLLYTLIADDLICFLYDVDIRNKSIILPNSGVSRSGTAPGRYSAVGITEEEMEMAYEVDWSVCRCWQDLLVLRTLQCITLEESR